MAGDRERQRVMAMNDDDQKQRRSKRRLEDVLSVRQAVSGLSEREMCDVFLVAWMCSATNARTEVLIAPGGFPEERDRQVEQLRKMADLVACDEPDLEMERLFHEGDISKMLQRLRWLCDELDEGGT